MIDGTAQEVGAMEITGMVMETNRQDLVTTGWDEDGGMKPGDVITIAVRYVENPIGPKELARTVVPIPFRPLHNQVVIRVLKENEKIGSIFLPDSANDNKQHGAIGQVIAKGVGHRNKSRLQTTGPNQTRGWLGGYCALPLEPGDYVVFARSSGEAHEFAGQTYLVTPVEHIFAVLEDYDASGRDVATEREFGLQGQMEKQWNRPASEFPKTGGMHS